MGLDWKAWAALTVFVFQNAAMALLMRWNKSVAPPYNNSIAVLMQELALKLPLSFVLYAYDTRGAPISSMYADFKARADEWIKLSIPALLYTVQNIMLYVGYANLEAAIGMVTYQTKVIFTALCSVLLLGRRLSLNQWLSVAILAVGIVCVQGIFDHKAPPVQAHARAPVITDAPLITKHHGHSVGGGRRPHAGSAVSAASSVPPATGRLLLAAAAADGHTSSVPLGIAAMLLASACTSFASVYFEKMLKSDSKPNLWLRNIQLAGYSSIIAVMSLYFAEKPPQGWFHNFGFNAWLSVWTNALGGLLVAVTIKYADNILRGFAQALAIIMGAVGSYFFFSFTFSSAFVVGVALVIASVFLYGDKTRTPCELASKVASCGAESA